MRFRVLKSLHLRKTLTTALVLSASLAAGCSGGVARFDDGFYTGAVPQANVAQAAYPNSLDQTMTGSIAPAAGGYQNYPAQAAPTPQVQSGQLPPPPSAPNYQTQDNRVGSSGYPTSGGGNYPSSAPLGVPGQSAAMAPQQSGIGAPPTSLNEQARRIATPAGRPSGSSTTQVAATRQGEAAPVRSSGGSSVTVASGDTLSAIARRSGVSASAIRSANGMTGDTVRIGQTLTIPAASNVQTQVAANTAAAPKPYIKPTSTSPVTTTASTPAPATTPETQTAAKQDRPTAAPAAAAASEPVRQASLEPAPTVSETAATGTAESAPSASGISQFRWPVQGRILARYGDKVGSRRNDGLNISVPRGTPVKAAENGVVIYAGDGLKEFGNTVLVKHDNGLVTVYGNADKLNVKRGDTVKRGDQIASSGMSGDTDVPQLHFEVRKNSAPVDPSQFLQ